MFTPAKSAFECVGSKPPSTLSGKPGNESIIRMSYHRFLKFTAAAALGVSLVLSPLAAVADMSSDFVDVSQRTRSQYKPSQAQLSRLSQLEPYIRYFTSLSYGPAEAKVSPDYIRALILTESGGDTWARSSLGARGLTQIIRSTAQHVAEDLAEGDYDYLYIDEAVLEEIEPDDLHDPALNILLACYLNANYHHRYDGRRDLMISAWNAGPGAVRRYGNQPPPFPETQATIFKVESYLSYLEEGGVY